MSLSQIQKTILQPLIDETLANLSSMAGMQGRVDEGFTDDINQFRFKGYAICAETHGAIDGVVLMHHYVETAVSMGNAVRRYALGEETAFEEINEPMADALAEWGNTVLGRASGLLGQSRLNIRFDPPYFVFDTDMMKSVLTGVTDIITVPVHVDGVGRFYFNYLIRSINVDMDEVREGEAGSSRGNDDSVVLGTPRAEPVSPDGKIMIVDDMKMIRKSLTLYLKKLGYTNVIEAQDGQEAVEKNASEQPDCIFMDVVMPNMNGSDALKSIREHSPATPVVMLTSVADKEVIDECQSIGIDGYIIKPLTTETGPDALRQFLGG